jgi:hypothetical protein
MENNLLNRRSGTKLTCRMIIAPWVELHRRIARGFRNLDNYRLRMILAAGRLTHPNLR